MASVRLKHADFFGWSQALWVEAGRLTLIFVPQVGGRLMGLQWDRQDLFWVNPDLAGQALDPQLLRNPSLEKVDLGFLLWGGNKTWLAPQAQWPQALPFIDLDSGVYDSEILHLGDGAGEDPAPLKIVLTSPVCRESGIQITRTVTVQDQGWSIQHQLQNQSDRPAQWGIWSNTMVRRPAQVWFPLGMTSVFFQGVKTFTEEGDSSIMRSQVISLHPAMARVRCETAAKFKYGVDSEQGSVLTAIPLADGQVLGWVSQFPTFTAESYGHGCTAEVFNAAAYDYLEVEIHSPVRSLAPGDILTLTETNHLMPLSTLPETHREVMALLSLVPTVP